MPIDRLYTGFVSDYPEIQDGDFIEIVDVADGQRRQYPPVGSVVPVILHGGETNLDCNDWNLRIRNGFGLTYILSKEHKLRGIAKFLKERGL